MHVELIGLASSSSKLFSHLLIVRMFRSFRISTWFTTSFTPRLWSTWTFIWLALFFLHVFKRRLNSFVHHTSTIYIVKFSRLQWLLIKLVILFLWFTRCFWICWRFSLRCWIIWHNLTTERCRHHWIDFYIHEVLLTWNLVMLFKVVTRVEWVIVILIDLTWLLIFHWLRIRISSIESVRIVFRSCGRFS